MASLVTRARRAGGEIVLLVLVAACCFLPLILIVQLFPLADGTGGTHASVWPVREGAPSIRVLGPTPSGGSGRGAPEVEVPAIQPSLVTLVDDGSLDERRPAGSSGEGSRPGDGAPPGAKQPENPDPPPQGSPSAPPPPSGPPPEEPILALAESSVALGRMSLTPTGDAGSAVISLVIGEGAEGSCDAGETDAVRIGIASSDESVATVTPSTLVYRCTGTETVSIIPVGPGTAIVELHKPPGDPSGTDFDLGGASFEVEVLKKPQSNTAPELSTLRNIVTVAEQGGATVTWDATANDVEDGALIPLCTPPSGSLFGIGTSTVNCAVTDSGGLSDEADFEVEVNPPGGGPDDSKPDDSKPDDSKLDDSKPDEDSKPAGTSGSNLDTVVALGSVTDAEAPADVDAPEVVVSCPSGVTVGEDAVAVWVAHDVGSGLSGSTTGSVPLPTQTPGRATATVPAGAVRDKSGNESPEAACGLLVLPGEEPKQSGDVSESSAGAGAVTGG